MTEDRQMVTLGDLRRLIDHAGLDDSTPILIEVYDDQHQVREWEPSGSIAVEVYGDGATAVKFGLPS